MIVILSRAEPLGQLLTRIPDFRETRLEGELSKRSQAETVPLFKRPGLK